MDKELFNFIKDAYQSGLCDEYKDEIRKCGDDKLQLMRLAMRQQSIPFVATKLYDGVATKEYLLQTFGGFLNGFILNDCDGVNGYRYAWYVDYGRYCVIDVNVAHISFTKDVAVNIPTGKCPIIYVSNRSNVRLSLDGFSSVKVYVFDESSIVFEDVDEDSRITVYRYSDKAVVSKGKYCFGNVNVYDKELRL